MPSDPPTSQSLCVSVIRLSEARNFLTPRTLFGGSKDSLEVHVVKLLVQIDALRSCDFGSYICGDGKAIE